MNSKTYWMAMSLGILSLAAGNFQAGLSGMASGHKKSMTKIQQKTLDVVKKRNRRKAKAAKISKKRNR